MLRAQSIEKLAAVQIVVEVVPVQGAQGCLVVAVFLPPGRQEMQNPLVRELPVQRDGIIFNRPMCSSMSVGDRLARGFSSTLRSR